MKNLDASVIVDEVIRTRKSVRAFLPTPIAHDTILSIIEVASRAPSGSNIQPWKVYVLEGQAKHRLTQAVQDVFNDPAQRALHRPEYVYYPKTWVSPFYQDDVKSDLIYTNWLVLGAEKVKKCMSNMRKTLIFLVDC